MINLVTLTTLLTSIIPVPCIKQEYSSKMSFTSYWRPVEGSNPEVIGDPHLTVLFTVKWVVTLSPILKIFLSFVVNL